ncbi:MAG TPA: VOC family protein [Gaiellaceae bacterium]|nr:VOC family protein [Gaiellaceae bacterium]
MAIVPMLSYEDAAAAIDWLCSAFDFAEDRSVRYTNPEGVVTHAEIERDGARVMLATPNAEYRSPRSHRESCAEAARWLDNPWVIDGVFVEVEDIESHYGRAVEAGATILREPNEPGVGFRIYSAEDPEGHRWMFGQRTGES